VFYLVEALLKAGREIGLAEEDTRKLVIATVTGAAHMLHETGIEPGELRRRVTSRGGTTEAAIEVLNKRGTQHTIVAAVRAAHKRAKELSA
jgi:pyrroline-5-carboxylate reductase